MENHNNNENKSEQNQFKKVLENIPMALTFDDVLMIPQYSDINSRKDCSLISRFSRNVKLKIPLVSSPMDTVTETEMAIEMARNGALGIIHRFQSIEDQTKMVEKVKRSETHIIRYPICVSKTCKISQVEELIKLHNIATFLVTNESEISFSNKSPPRKGSNVGKMTLAGIVTSRDLKFRSSGDQLVEEVMTPLKKLVTFNTENQKPDPVFLKDTMIKNRIEKIPLVGNEGEIQGLVTLKDISRLFNDTNANLDEDGSLIVGAAVGAKDDYIERARSLIDVGCNVLIVDVANGHSQLCIDAVRKLKSLFPDVDIVAGSVASGEGALKLIEAGADGIRCGIGNGSICITRIVSGAGVPQLSALLDCAPVCKKYGIPLISDGGNRNSGNMCKALAAGADCVMLGRLVAGCEESPSKVIYRDGKLCKVYRGMAGYGANVAKAQRIGDQEPSNKTFTPEGVEGYIPYSGPLKDVLHQFFSGIQSGMSYSGARSISQLQEKAQFIRITSSGKHESGVHDINKI